MKAGDKFGLVLVVVIVVALAVLCIVGPSKKQESVPGEAPTDECVQFGRLAVGGADRRVEVDTTGQKCLKFIAVLDGHSAYLVVDAPDGVAPIERSNFQLRGRERGYNRYILCYLNAESRAEAEFEVPFMVGTAVPRLTTVAAGVYPFAENETCAGWSKTSGPARAAQ